jgi:hypothetical protein
MITKTETDTMLIHQIAERASALYADLFHTKVDPAFIASELAIVHREVIPLKLRDLLEADNVNFAHDIGGIHKHLFIGTRSIKLSDGFMPRFSKMDP